MPHLRGVFVFAAKVGIAAALLALPAFSQAPPSPAPRFVVVLDAAHGGDDSGGTLKDSSGAVIPEKSVTLALSVRLRSLLAARGITVVTTRESDSTVTEDRRAEIANHAKAQACLSLHASQTGSGIHLFSSSLAPASSNQFVAWKTAQAAWVMRSLAFAGDLNSALLHAGMNVTLGRTALITVDSMACPAVALEVAPDLSSGHEPASPGDSAYQIRVAQALAAAILQWRSNPARTEAVHP